MIDTSLRNHRFNNLLHTSIKEGANVSIQSVFSPTETPIPFTTDPNAQSLPPKQI